MSFTCERPYSFYGLVVLIPAIIISIVQYRRCIFNIKFFMLNEGNLSCIKRSVHLSKIIILRTIFLNLSWIMLVLAYAGISWGTYFDPIQKNGTAVSLVFDISGSMNAQDGPGGMSRLEAMKKYTAMLLPQMPETLLSVILAKGDGMPVIPLTEDRKIIESLLASLNTNLMSSPGSSLGKGIRTALKSFPENSPLANTIWVFTDGDETDGNLESAIGECMRSGVSLAIIGFGQEQEIRIIAGDGKTPVMTALRSKKILNAIENARRKNSAFFSDYVEVQYIDASETGSAVKLLSSISSTPLDFEDEQENSLNVRYELKPVLRYELFLGLAIAFFVLSIFVSQLDFTSIYSAFYKCKPIACIFVLILFSSCNLRINASKSILFGAVDWYQRRYNDASAYFYQAMADSLEAENEFLLQYAVYNLGVTYLQQNENEAALDRFSQISDEAPANVRYAALYNQGIIFYRQGDYTKAVEKFKHALEIDGTKFEAKINYELAMLNAEKEAKDRENALLKVETTGSKSAMQDIIFKHIKENERQQWKSSTNTDNSLLATDY